MAVCKESEFGEFEENEKIVLALKDPFDDFLSSISFETCGLESSIYEKPDSDEISKTQKINQEFDFGTEGFSDSSSIDKLFSSAIKSINSKDGVKDKISCNSDCQVVAEKGAANDLLSELSKGKSNSVLPLRTPKPQILKSETSGIKRSIIQKPEFTRRISKESPLKESSSKDSSPPKTAILLSHDEVKKDLMKKEAAKFQKKFSKSINKNKSSDKTKRKHNGKLKNILSKKYGMYKYSTNKPTFDSHLNNIYTGLKKAQGSVKPLSEDNKDLDEKSVKSGEKLLTSPCSDITNNEERSLSNQKDISSNNHESQKHKNKDSSLLEKNNKIYHQDKHHQNSSGSDCSNIVDKSSLNKNDKNSKRINLKTKHKHQSKSEKTKKKRQLLSQNNTTTADHRQSFKSKSNSAKFSDGSKRIPSMLSAKEIAARKSICLDDKEKNNIYFSSDSKDRSGGMVDSVTSRNNNESINSRNSETKLDTKKELKEEKTYHKITCKSSAEEDENSQTKEERPPSGQDYKKKLSSQSCEKLETLQLKNCPAAHEEPLKKEDKKSESILNCLKPHESKEFRIETVSNINNLESNKSGDNLTIVVKILVNDNSGKQVNEKENQSIKIDDDDEFDTLKITREALRNMPCLDDLTDDYYPTENLYSLTNIDESVLNKDINEPILNEEINGSFLNKDKNSPVSNNSCQVDETENVNQDMCKQRITIKSVSEINHNEHSHVFIPTDTASNSNNSELFGPQESSKVDTVISKNPPNYNEIMATRQKQCDLTIEDLLNSSDFTSINIKPSQILSQDTNVASMTSDLQTARIRVAVTSQPVGSRDQCSQRSAEISAPAAVFPSPSSEAVLSSNIASSSASSNAVQYSNSYGVILPAPTSQAFPPLPAYRVMPQYVNSTAGRYSDVCRVTSTAACSVTASLVTSSATVSCATTSVAIPPVANYAVATSAATSQSVPPIGCRVIPSSVNSSSAVSWATTPVAIPSGVNYGAATAVVTSQAVPPVGSRVIPSSVNSGAVSLVNSSSADSWASTPVATPSVVNYGVATSAATTLAVPSVACSVIPSSVNSAAISWATTPVTNPSAANSQTTQPKAAFRVMLNPSAKSTVGRRADSCGVTSSAACSATVSLVTSSGAVSLPTYSVAIPPPTNYGVAAPTTAISQALSLTGTSQAVPPVAAYRLIPTSVNSAADQCADSFRVTSSVASSVTASPVLSSAGASAAGAFGGFRTTATMAVNPPVPNNVAMPLKALFTMNSNDYAVRAMHPVAPVRAVPPADSARMVPLVTAATTAAQPARPALPTATVEWVPTARGNPAANATHSSSVSSNAHSTSVSSIAMIPPQIQSTTLRPSSMSSNVWGISNAARCVASESLSTVPLQASRNSTPHFSQVRGQLNRQAYPRNMASLQQQYRLRSPQDYCHPNQQFKYSQQSPISVESVRSNSIDKAILDGKTDANNSYSKNISPSVKQTLPVRGKGRKTKATRGKRVYANSVEVKSINSVHAHTNFEVSSKERQASNHRNTYMNRSNHELNAVGSLPYASDNHPTLESILNTNNCLPSNCSSRSSTIEKSRSALQKERPYISQNNQLENTTLQHLFDDMEPSTCGQSALPLKTQNVGVPTINNELYYSVQDTINHIVSRQLQTSQRVESVSQNLIPSIPNQGHSLQKNPSQNILSTVPNSFANINQPDSNASRMSLPRGSTSLVPQNLLKKKLPSSTTQDLEGQGSRAPATGGNSSNESRTSRVGVSGQISVTPIKNLVNKSTFHEQQPVIAETSSTTAPHSTDTPLTLSSNDKCKDFVSKEQQNLNQQSNKVAPKSIVKAVPCNSQNNKDGKISSSKNNNNNNELPKTSPSHKSNSPPVERISITPSGENICPPEWIEDIDMAAKVYAGYKLIDSYAVYEQKFIESLEERRKKRFRVRSRKPITLNGTVDLTIPTEFSSNFLDIFVVPKNPSSSSCFERTDQSVSVTSVQSSEVIIEDDDDISILDDPPNDSVGNRAKHPHLSGESSDRFFKNQSKTDKGEIVYTITDSDEETDTNEPLNQSFNNDCIFNEASQFGDTMLSTKQSIENRESDNHELAQNYKSLSSIFNQKKYDKNRIYEEILKKKLAYYKTLESENVAKSNYIKSSNNDSNDVNRKGESPGPKQPNLKNRNNCSDMDISTKSKIETATKISIEMNSLLDDDKNVKKDSECNIDTSKNELELFFVNEHLNTRKKAPSSGSCEKIVTQETSSHDQTLDNDVKSSEILKTKLNCDSTCSSTDLNQNLLRMETSSSTDLCNTDKSSLDSGNCFPYLIIHNEDINKLISSGKKNNPSEQSPKLCIPSERSNRVDSENIKINDQVLNGDKNKEDLVVINQSNETSLKIKIVNSKKLNINEELYSGVCREVETAHSALNVDEELNSDKRKSSSKQLNFPTSMENQSSTKDKEKFLKLKFKIKKCSVSVKRITRELLHKHKVDPIVIRNLFPQSQSDIRVKDYKIKKSVSSSISSSKDERKRKHRHSEKSSGNKERSRSESRKLKKKRKSSCSSSSSSVSSTYSSSSYKELIELKNILSGTYGNNSSQSISPLKKNELKNLSSKDNDDVNCGSVKIVKERTSSLEQEESFRKSMSTIYPKVIDKDKKYGKDLSSKASSSKDNHRSSIDKNYKKSDSERRDKYIHKSQSSKNSKIHDTIDSNLKTHIKNVLKRERDQTSSNSVKDFHPKKLSKHDHTEIKNSNKIAGGEHRNSVITSSKLSTKVDKKVKKNESINIDSVLRRTSSISNTQNRRCSIPELLETSINSQSRSICSVSKRRKSENDKEMSIMVQIDRERMSDKSFCRANILKSNKAQSIAQKNKGDTSSNNNYGPLNDFN